MDLAPLTGTASEKLLAALNKLSGTEGTDIKGGLDELAQLVKRSDDVSDCMDVLLKAGLVAHILNFLAPDCLNKYAGEASVRGFAPEAIILPMGEAIQLSACACLGELVWHRDTASEVRPVFLESYGLVAVAELVANTHSERVRLKALIIARRMLYEVGSSGSLDSTALKGVRDSQLVAQIVDLIPRVCDESDPNVTMDTLEGVCYLLQRMQVCLDQVQKEELDLAVHLRTASAHVTSLLRGGWVPGQAPKRLWLDVGLLAVRELCWDDANKAVEPGLSCMAEAGAFEAIAVMLAPTVRPSLSGGVDLDKPPNSSLNLLGKPVVDTACSLLQRLAAAPPGTLSGVLAAQVPRLMHMVIARLVEQLDTAAAADHEPEREGATLSALRKLLVMEGSEEVPQAAAEAAEAEGVPARLRAVALAGAAFGGQGEDVDGGVVHATASAAAALLLDLAVATAVPSAQSGAPAQAAEALEHVEPVVASFMSQPGSDLEACRAFCRALYQLSMVRYDEPSVGDVDTMSEWGDSTGGPSTPPAPPEEEQYALSSALVTLVGRVADGISALLNGERRPRPPAAVFNAHRKSNTTQQAAEAEQEAATPPQAADGPSILERLRRACTLIHELTGFKPLVGSSPVSRHNLDALFVHSTIQSLVAQTEAFYNSQRSLLRAARRAAQEGALAGAQSAQDEVPAELQRLLMPGTPSRASSASAQANPLLHPLLHHDSGALELIKELVRDVAEARIKLRDIGALPKLTRMLSENPRDNLLVSLMFNFSRAEALHSALKQEGVVFLMEKVLNEGSATQSAHDQLQYEVRRLLALCTLGVVVSDTGTRGEADAGSKRAAALLEAADMPGLLERIIRDAARDGHYIISTSASAWPFMLEPAALTVQCLARVDSMARKLAEKRIPAMLANSLHNRHGSTPDVSLRICRALLNFARLPDLRAGLLAAGVADAVMSFASSEDARIADAARGTLLQLGELSDKAAKLALQSSLPEALFPILSQPLPRNGDKVSDAEPVLDVMVSFKRADAHSFARSLHTLLVLRGVGCCMNYEYRQDLSDVEQVVARARNLVLVLTDNVLSSPRCLAELEAAVRNNVHVVVVVKEGARWGDASGNLLTFPSALSLKALSPEIAKVFSLKPIQHRDEHYAHFAGQLVKRIRVAAPPSMPTGGQLTRLSHPAVSVALTPAALAHSASQFSPTAAMAAFHTQSVLPAAAQAQDMSLESPSLPVATHQVSRKSNSSSSMELSGVLAQLQQITSQMNMLNELQAEMASLKASVASGTAATTSVVQSLAGDVNGLRRELAAEVTASGRAVSAEVSGLSQQMRSALAAETSANAATAATLRGDLTAQMSQLKSDLTSEVSQQMRSMSSEMSDMRRAVSGLMDGMVSLQGLVRSLMLNRGGGATSPDVSASFMRSAPPVVHATSPDSNVFHSAPITSSPFDGAASSTAPAAFTTDSGYGLSSSLDGSKLPPISNGTLSSPPYPPPSRRSSYSPYAPSPQSATPNVGGFQGARLQAVQKSAGVGRTGPHVTRHH